MRVVIIAACALALTAGIASAQEATPPEAVPGPMRPIGVVPPSPPATPADPRRAARKDPPPPAAPQRPTPPAPTAAPAAVYEGAFRPGATGEKAEGRAVARLATHDLKLEKLAVTPGRDLEVWLVAIDRLGNGADLTDVKRVSLGKLKRTEGDQSYRMPPEIDLRVYRTVVVWSRRERQARAGALLLPQAATQKPARGKPPRNR